MPRDNNNVLRTYLLQNPRDRVFSAPSAGADGGGIRLHDRCVVPPHRSDNPIQVVVGSLAVPFRRLFVRQELAQVSVGRIETRQGSVERASEG